MGITRAQYLQGDNSQTPVLPGSVQAVTAGYGVSIATDGTISVVPSVLPQARIINLGVLESIDGARSTFTLVEYGSSTPYTLTSLDNLAVFLGGVPQLPGTAYTASATQVNFVSAPPAGTTFLAITVAEL